MQSIIIHKLYINDGDWEIRIAPRVGERLRYRFIGGLRLDRSSEPLVETRVSKYMHDIEYSEYDHQGINSFLSQERSNVPEGFRVIATLPGGFWYRFSHHLEKMSTYIKKKQYVVILENEYTVFAAISDIGQPVDYSVLKTNSSGFRGDGLSKVFHYMVDAGERRNAIEELKSFTKGARKVSIIDPYLLGGITGKCEVNQQFFTLAQKRISNRAILNVIENMIGKTYGSKDKLLKYIEKYVSLKDKEQQAITKLVEELFVKESYVSDLMKATSANDISELNLLYSKRHAEVPKVRKQIESSFSGKLRFSDLDKYDELFVHDRVWIVDSRKAVVVGNSFGGLGMSAISFILDLPEKDLTALKNEMKVTGIKI
jgi:hypothetical protein